jgi:putative ABC transport system permease protein
VSGGALRRGLRNITRNRTRGLLVVVLLAVSVWMFATLLQAATATERQAAQLRAEVGTLVQVNPRGAPAGGGGAGRGLSETVVDEVAALPGVARVNPIVREQFQDNDKRAQMGAVTGVEPGRTLSLAAMGGFTGNPRLIAGRNLAPGDASQPAAVVGEVFARQYGAGVGERFTLPGELFRGVPGGEGLQARVVGIYRTGVVFGDNQVFVPLRLAQRSFATEGRVSSLQVQATDAQAVPDLVAALKRTLGERADVIANQPAAQRAVNSLQSAAGNSRLGATAAGVVAAAVVAFTMVLVVRQRRTEIGVLKALGASNTDVTGQFVTEALGMALLGGLSGIGLTLASGETLAQVLLGEQTVAGGLAPGAATTAWSLALAAAAGLAGVLYPLRQALRLRPAEAIRPT